MRGGATPDAGGARPARGSARASRPGRRRAAGARRHRRWFTCASPSSTCAPATSRSSRRTAPRWSRTARSTTTPTCGARMAGTPFRTLLGLRTRRASVCARWRRVRRRICAECMPSPSTTRRAAGWCWRAIRSASNRSTTCETDGLFAFASEPQALVAAGSGAPPRPMQLAARRASATQVHHRRATTDLSRHPARAAGRDAGGRGGAIIDRRLAAPRCRPARRLPIGHGDALRRARCGAARQRHRASALGRAVRAVPVRRHRQFGAARADAARDRHRGSRC